MVYFKTSADPRSADIIRKDKVIGYLQWHTGRDPRILLAEPMEGLSISEMYACLQELHTRTKTRPKPIGRRPRVWLVTMRLKSPSGGEQTVYVETIREETLPPSLVVAPVGPHMIEVISNLAIEYASKMRVENARAEVEKVLTIVEARGDVESVYHHDGTVDGPVLSNG